jgi:hydroxymethylbilane synthase
MKPLRIGTRGSQLALYQANAVAALLRERASIACEIVIIRTSGDRLAEAKLSQIGGKRLFVKEIEDALLEGAVDLAVHSSKDMPAVLPDGLEIAAVLPREDARDAIVLPQSGPTPHTFDDVVAHLGRTPRIGTSSVRRTAQLLPIFPHARFLPIRGNLDTRLRKLDLGEFDAIVLASAGLRRLGFDSRISASVPATVCVPAPGQGIIAVETRAGDRRVGDIVVTLNDATAHAALEAERSVVRRLGGGCQMPIGAYAELAGERLSLSAIVMALDGTRALRAAATGTPARAVDLGYGVADRLLAQGAAEILEEVERSQVTVEGLQP